MADNVDITAGAGTTVATDQVGSVHFQRVKLVDGTLDSSTGIPGDATNGLDVDVTRVQGTVTVADGGGSLTVDGTVTANAGTGFPGVATDGSAVITTGTLSMGTDGTNAQTMRMTTAGEQYVFIGGDDGAGGFQTASFDATLTDNEANNVSHLNVHSRGAIWNGTGWDRVRGDTTNGMDVDVTRVSGNVTVVQPTGSNLNAVVSGTVTANLAAGTNNIGDVDVLSVPAPLSTSGGGTEASALRVTIANDSTGLVSVDDNGSSLTVDDGGGSITVDGTVTANAGTGSFTVAQATASNLNATVRAQDGAGNNLTSEARGSQRALSVQILDGSGAQITSFGGGTQYVEDDASAGGETGTILLGVRNDAAATKTSADGDFSAIATDPAGRVGIADLGGSITVDGTVTANAGTGSFTVAQASAANLNATVTGTVTVTQATAANLKTDANVTNAFAALTGSGTTAGTLRVNVATDNTVAVDGDVAHGTTDSGNPVKLGAKTIAHGTAPTAVAAGARTDLYANRHGVLFTMGGHPNIQTIKANFTAAQTGTILVTVGAAQKIVVTRVSVLASNANTVNPSVAVGTNTTTTLTNTDTMLSHPGLAPGSGVVEGNGAGILAIGALDADLRFTCTVPTGGSLDVVASYYLIES